LEADAKASKEKRQLKRRRSFQGHQPGAVGHQDIEFGTCENTEKHHHKHGLRVIVA
jgi:hypothetical protein